MSKFFKVNDKLVNLSRVSDVIFKEDKLVISFRTPENQFNKHCENQKEFEKLCALVFTHLDIIDLDETNNPKQGYGTAGQRIY